MKLPGKAVVWLVYLDANLPRRLGRKVPRSLAVEAPTLGELVEACKRLKLEFQLRRDARYPRIWWGRRGYIIVDKFASKSKLLKALALEIRRLRSEKTEYGHR
ncbi:signal recognition particle protein Srp19 [Candidatus Bathyarchaeota archaeon]|mgnify:FL=1|nr:MAG: signal recognition particle protein Srp19 [Candidatus Bathyarchaeota archaeon]